MTAFIHIVACSLVLWPWASASFPPYRDFKTLLGERASDYYDMSYILFGLGAVSSQEPVLLTSATVGEGADEEQLMILRAHVTLFGWHRGFLHAVVGRVWKWTGRTAIVFAFVCIQSEYGIDASCDFDCHRSWLLVVEVLSGLVMVCTNDARGRPRNTVIYFIWINVVVMLLITTSCLRISVAML